jgi:hypothetical protein
MTTINIIAIIALAPPFVLQPTGHPDCVFSEVPRGVVFSEIASGVVFSEKGS